MQGFEPVTLAWKGKSYTVPANQQMMLIAKIEDALSGDSGQQAFAILCRKGGPPHSRLAAAFGAALRHAGARVTDEDVYLSIMEDIATKSAKEVMLTVQGAVIAILSIISPPAAKVLAGTTESPPEKKA